MNSEINNAIEEIINSYGSWHVFLGKLIIELSMTGQPCDITFHNKPPSVNVIIDKNIHVALMYGAGAEKLKNMLENIKLSNGTTISIADIWTINPMPSNGFSQEDLDAIDLLQAEDKVGPNGETLRKMISDTYQCKSRKDEDYYLRRFIAS